ncbi:hypothetical protein Back11_20280 [Paenibacillus baekrokdamisoli]|uniref:Uncharacterized protein n=1 Tax=Paenibacillus baekrokdamisoli TaxID=1712516 RepID=A0A3G9J758_9BACL|nr:hypothetical protein [Paenibacillus baekrokdamisoli]MBB3069966.1 hypothetical protein [Paenibacillus baekrokdamisoli]BBH20683.1 hypothetical protein Back11_20280 [Paenibacillus baekrokdamisoli]
MKWNASKIGLIASMGCIVLCVIFLFWNPYSSLPVNRSTILIVSIMLILPACLGILAAWFRIQSLMYVTLIWSIPYGLYLAIVSVPSLWNLFGIVLLLYFVSAVQMGREVATN